jgi:hypothetical protein
MIKSKKISGLLTEDVKLGKKDLVKSSPQKGESKEPKPYPIPEEDSFIPPDDDSAEVKYNIKKKS